MYQARRFDDLYMEAHSLKGEAGNIGARALQAAADRVCEHLKTHPGERIDGLIADLVREYDAMAALARKFEYPPPATPPTAASTREAPSSEQVLALLEKLDAALKAKSLDARRLMSELDELTRGTALAADLADLVQAVQQLHYGQAQASLEVCVKRLTDKG